MKKVGYILHEQPLFLSTFILAGNISTLNMSIIPNQKHCYEQLVQYAEKANIPHDMYLKSIPMYIKKLLIKPYGHPENYDDLDKVDKLLKRYGTSTYIKNEGFMFYEIVTLEKKGNYYEAITKSNNYLNLFLNGKRLEYISPETLQYAKKIYRMMVKMYNKSEMYVHSIRCLNILEEIVLTNNNFFTLNGNSDEEYKAVHTNIKEINDVYYGLIGLFSLGGYEEEVAKNYAKIR